MILFETDTAKRIELLITESTNVSNDGLKVGARLKVGDVEYVFPGKIVNDAIVVEVPPLSEAIPGDLSDSAEYDIVIEAISDDTYLVPFADKFTVRSKAKIEARLRSDEDVAKPVVERRLKAQLQDSGTRAKVRTDNAPPKKSLSEKFLEA